MEAKHTPGPIEVKKRKRHGFTQWWLTSQHIAGFDPLDGENFLGCTSFDHPRGEGNARLWAAAPDLLEALETLADYVETDQRGEGPIPLPTPGQIADAVIAARAAIAKAKGE